MIISYAPKFLLVNTAKLATVVLSPVIALRYYRQEESRVTGYPSQFPGKLREHIDWPFEWAATFDDCADAHWYSGRTAQMWPFKGKTQADYDASAWLRYCSRVLWLCRNPAYTFARDLGFDETGLETTIHQDESEYWDKGIANTTYRTFTNAYGKRGFLYERQIHIGNQWFLELVLGYKIPWTNERKNRAMVASRVTIKRYPRL